MPAIPPGIVYIFSLLVPTLGTPTAAVLFGRILLSRCYAVELPSWTVAPLVGLWFGVSATYRGWVESSRQKKECAEMGAVQIVSVPPRMPGGINAIQVVRKSMQSGYLGTLICDHDHDIDVLIDISLKGTSSALS